VYDVRPSPLRGDRVGCKLANLAEVAAACTYRLILWGKSVLEKHIWKRRHAAVVAPSHHSLSLLSLEFIDKMRFSGISAIALALASVASSAALKPRNDLLADLQNQAMEALKQAEAEGTLGKRSCSLSNAYARRNW